MAKTQILIVEDERIVAEDIRISVENMGYAVSAIVSSGEEALRKAEENRTDLVLMDIVLEGDMSGIEAAAHIRSSFHIPVVYLTAYADEEILKQAKITEPFGYIIKPFEERELRSAIELALYRHNMEEELRRSEKRYRELADLLPQSVFELNKNGNLTFGNRMAFELFGFTQESVDKGLNALELFAPEDRDRLAQNTQDIVSGKKLGGIEYTALRKDGSTFPALIYSAPIMHENKPVGLRGIIIDITERKQAEEEIRQSFDKLQRTMKDAIRGMASMVEMKNPFLAGHQERVANLAIIIATNMGLPEKQVTGTLMAASVHDIGEIRVPTEILLRPSKLGETEMNVIKTHPQVGYDILKTVEFAWPVAEIVLQHHERMDGSGYPEGLSGDDILLEARILSVADVIEAMVSPRPHRAALDKQKALEEISSRKGILYELEVVNACLRIFAEQGFTFN